MTLHTPPSWLQNGSHPAENDRLTTQALWATTGIINTSSLAVTANSPVNMSVNVASGWAAIVGTTQPNMGTYVAYNDATVNLPITTADPTHPRIDVVCMTVNDSYYSGALDNVILQVVAGTPIAVPVPPATPANSIKLAEVTVPAGALSISSGDISDERIETTTNVPVTGDITGVTAGTGLSGGGTSGTVTLSIDTAVTADLTTAQTLTNKSLTSPRINLGITTDTSTAFTPAITDNGKLVTLSNANPITATIPPFASVPYPVGAQLNFVQLGAGQVTFAQGAGVTIVSTGATASAPELRAQYSSATAICTSQDNWLIAGDIS